MSLEIYPADFSTRYGLYAASAISMEEAYNDIGKISIIEPLDDYAIVSLKPGNIVYNTARGTTYVLVNVKSDTTKQQITANGYTAEWMLNKRCVANKKKIVTIEEDTYSLISNNLRGLSRIDLAPIKGLTETFQEDDPETEDDDESVISDGQLLDQVTEVLAYGKLGRRMIWDSKALKWTFEIFKGIVRTEGIHAVAFVEEQGTCTDLVINEDESTFKNVAYIMYKYNDKEYQTSVGEAEGDNRRELWCSNTVIAEEKESQKAVEKRAKEQASLALGKYLKRTSFSVTIDPDEFGAKYDLGDTVSCVSNRFGVAFQAQVTGYKYTLDSNGETTSIVLGEPTLTAIDEVILRNGN